MSERPLKSPSRPAQDQSIALQRETRERLIQGNAMWAAGLLSIGGGIDIDPVIEDNIQRAIPRISFPDNDYKKAHRLLELFGGRIYEHSKYTGSEYNWTWTLEARDEAWLMIDAVLPHMPSHTRYLEPGKAWSQMTDLERYKKATKIKTQLTTLSAPIPPEAYAILANNPQFVAGVIDGRASLITGHEQEPQIPTLEVYSSNKSLLQALYGRRGGNFEEKILRYNGGDRSRSVWSLPYKVAKDLYTAIQPYSILRRERATVVFEGRAN